MILQKYVNSASDHVDAKLLEFSVLTSVEISADGKTNFSGVETQKFWNEKVFINVFNLSQYAETFWLR